MMIPLLLLILGLQSQQELESRIQQKQREIDQLHSELNEQKSQVGQLQQVVGRQEQELRRPFCSAELGFVSASETRLVSRDAALAIPLSLQGAVSKPANACLPAEIRVTASYLDAFD